VVVPCKYKAGRVLGRGTYAEVKEMVHIGTGRRFAGKVISRDRMSNSSRLVQNEIAVLKQLSRKHPNLLALVDYFYTPRNTYLITELCEGGELFEYIHRRSSLGEAEAAHVVRQIVEGVAFLHANGIMHRDLKTENCLVRTDESGAPVSVAIADFGMAHQAPEDGGRIVTNVCGTPGYMAPEMIQRLGHGKPVDMWAVGVIAYFALSGSNPFQRHNRAAEFQAIVAGAYEFAPAHRWAGVSSAARDFISSLLVIDPACRMTAQQALEHRWLQARSSVPKSPVPAHAVSSALDLDTHCQMSTNEDDSEGSSEATTSESQPAPFGASVPACATGRHTATLTGAGTEQPASAGPCRQKHNHGDRSCSDERRKCVPATSRSSQATCVSADVDGKSGLAKATHAQHAASSQLYHTLKQQQPVCPLAGHLDQVAAQFLQTAGSIPRLAASTAYYPPHTRR
ncbi:Calcium/calmodulin-dependent protein kinase type I, partial [Coemansia spiralis]